MYGKGGMMECLACKKKFTDRTAWQVHCRECRKDCDPELENPDDWIVRLRLPDPPKAD